MLPFIEDKKVIVKRYSSTLGEYNRPLKESLTVGTYSCHTAENSSNTAQLQPQKENTTDLTLYTDPEADIKKGDVLYIYEVDEYESIIPETELKALADKPYKKRTHLAVPLVNKEEV
jgi:bifunctional DNA-binding transcriptional regulator/antitoxin component of YhaV-PrlF toxin-antitoxin module